MGWANGTEVATRMITAITTNVQSKTTKRRLYAELIEALVDLDWDCTEEAEGLDPVFDKVLAEWEEQNA